MTTSRRAKTSVLSQYFSEIRDFPILTKEEEQQLARDIQRGSREALNELVEKTEEDLLNITNFGQKSLEEVTAKLDELGVNTFVAGGQLGRRGRCDEDLLVHGHSPRARSTIRASPSSSSWTFARRRARRAMGPVPVAVAAGGGGSSGAAGALSLALGALALFGVSGTAHAKSATCSHSFCLEEV